MKHELCDCDICAGATKGTQPAKRPAMQWDSFVPWADDDPRLAAARAKAVPA